MLFLHKAPQNKTPLQSTLIDTLSRPNIEWKWSLYKDFTSVAVLGKG